MSAAKPQPSGEATRIYLSEYDQLPFRDPDWTYLVLSPQGAGGDYLCRRLCNVRGRFGMPAEYLDPTAARILAPRLLPGTPPEKIPFARYMQAVQRARSSADGCFGIALQPAQLAAFAPGDRALFDFAATFERIVVLTRRDKAGQAIAGTIAQLTGTPFSLGKPATDDAHLSQLLPAIAANHARHIDEDRRIAALGKALDRPWLRLVYEDILSDGQGAFACLVEFLAAGEPMELEESADLPVPEMLPGDFPDELRARFLRYIGGGNAA